MVDKVAITAGVGTDVATDDCGAAGHAQVMKLAYATDGVATLIPADVDGLKVNLGADNDVTVTSGTITINAIPAGNNNIGDVDIVTMPNVVVSTLPAITGTGTFVVQIDGAALTSFQLSDDVVTVLGSSTYTEGTTKGTLIGGVRHDADTSLVGTDNETAPFQLDARGLIKVEAFAGETIGVSVGVIPSHAVTNIGTFAVQVDGAALTALQLIDDPVLSLGSSTYTEGTTRAMVIGGVRRDADTTLVDTTNEIAPFQVDARGCVKVEAFSGEVLPVSNAAGSFVVQENGAALTALQLIDDGVYTDDTSTHATGTSKGYGMMAVATPTDTAVNANDIGMIAMTLNREQLVQVNTALPAGTNAIGKLAANDGVDIGDVTLTAGTAAIGVVAMTSCTPGTAATNLGKAEDAGHTTADVGVMMLGVVNSTNADFTNADTDYCPIATDRAGNVYATTRKELVIVSVQVSSLTPSATAYAAGDQMGGMIEFRNMTRAATGSGTIVGIVAITGTNNIVATDLFIFDASVSCAADNAAAVFNDTHIAGSQGVINIPAVYAVGTGNRVGQQTNMAHPFVCLASGTMYGALITRGSTAFFGSSTDLTLKLFVERN